MSRPRTLSVPANAGVENEDVAVTGSAVVVIVDGAGAARRIRTAEIEQATSLREQGLKVHDDLTLVVQGSEGAVGIGDGYVGDDFYCDVAIPRSERLRIVREDDLVLAFHHTKPFWETHVVVVPKPHLTSLTTVTSADSEVLKRLFSVLQEVLRELESRCGAAAATVHVGGYQDSQHLHIHVHSGPRQPV